jgi:hypothetical protein
VFPKIRLPSSCNQTLPAETGKAAVAARFVFVISFRVVCRDME